MFRTRSKSPSGRRRGAPLLNAVLALCAAGVAAGWAQAADKELNAEGTLHTVVVEYRSPTEAAAGTRLVHKIQTPYEAMASTFIPGTDEPALDIEPCLGLSPGTGLPALVWSRQEGGHFRIEFTAYDGARWSPPRALTANAVDNRKPQIVWGPGGAMHVMWTSGALSDGSAGLYESILDSKGIVLLEPSPVRLVANTVVSQTSESRIPTLDVSGDLFAFDSSTKLQQRVSAYGGLDEPIPVGKRVDLLLPAGSAAIEKAKVEVVGSAVLVYAKSGSKLFYAIQTQDGWTPLRQLTLDSSLTLDGAEILIKSMIVRSATP